jgi:hypothetical protein
MRDDMNSLHGAEIPGLIIGAEMEAPIHSPICEEAIIRTGFDVNGV